MPTTPALPFFSGQTQPDGQTFDAWKEQPLLMSLEAGLINWPSSCRNGTCRTCIGKVTDGQVRYEIAWPGLSAEEKTEGYVLPCVAYPCSDVTLKRLE
jgi:ferredoxin